MTSDEDPIRNATNDCERRILSALVFALDEFGYDIAKVMQRVTARYVAERDGAVRDSMLSRFMRGSRTSEVERTQAIVNDVAEATDPNSQFHGLVGRYTKEPK